MNEKKIAELAMEYGLKCDPKNQTLEKQADIRQGYIAGMNKALSLFGVRLSLLDLDKIKQKSKAYADQYKTQASSEGLENIADDFQNGVRWALEFLRNEA
jgi:hypothetical protein